jgi:hypothetical protein
MRRVTPFIPSSHEACAPPLEGAYVRAPTSHVARGRTRSQWGARTYAPQGRGVRTAVGPHGRGRPRPRGAYVRGGPQACAPHGRARPRPTCPMTPHAPMFAPPRAPRPTRPTAVRAPTFAPPVRGPEAFAPPLRAPRDVCAHGSRSRPTACAPLECKFLKIVVHSTTWANRPSTTVRWMTAGCLGGDHSFLIYSHGPRAHPRMWLYACLI